jgi:hypothetical protein
MSTTPVAKLLAKEETYEQEKRKMMTAAVQIFPKTEVAKAEVLNPDKPMVAWTGSYWSIGTKWRPRRLWKWEDP